MTLADGVVLHVDDPGLHVDGLALAAALDSPTLEVWTGAKYDFPDEVGLFVTMNSPRMAQLHANQEAIDRGVVARRTLTGVPALVAEDSFAYRTARQVSEDPAGYESVVIAHGPQAESLAREYADLLRRWARDYCRRGTAVFRYQPGDRRPGTLPVGAAVKRHGVVTVSYP